MTPTKFGIGQPLRRKEDAALITGTGRFVADLVPAGALAMAVVRSPHAHARFTVGDTAEVLALQGVRLVLTAADIEGLGDLKCHGLVENADGSPMFSADIPILARGIARHVGDAVAIVVAETAALAKDAAAAFPVEFDPLDAVADTAAAIEAGAPVVWPEVGGNVAHDTLVGDQAATEQAFARAARVVRLEVVNNRVVANFLETRGVLGEYDPATRRYTLTVGSQGVHGIRDILCDDVFGIAHDRIRVITPDVGGGFGTKIFTYREYALALVAAERTGQPVYWIADRTEHFMADAQGRDNLSVAELALDADHRFLGLRVDTIANLGAYLSQYGPSIATLGATMLPGCYRLPAMTARVRGVYTNTAPVDAYRGAGRPEAAYLIERLVDAAARELGVDPAELRARNLVRSDEMPYRTATGRLYDSGDFVGHLRRALEAADRPGFAARRAASAARGRARGFGFATYIEACAFGEGEDAAVDLDPDGGVTVRIGTQSTGQGHATAYSQVVAEHLRLPPERVRMVQGDSDRIATGGGTGGSRSIPLGSVAVGDASRMLAEKIKALAADALEAAAGDLELDDGRVVVAGTDRAISFEEIARLPAARAEDLTGQGSFAHAEATYPNGTHVCELEVDPETGTVEILRYVIVDDFGLVLNPLLLQGQVHGGVAQGIGQALSERTVYDPDSGQLLSATLMDYALPRADNLGFFEFEQRNVPCAVNPLGIKGAGEAGSIGSCPAVMNAVVDALDSAFGIRHIDMPATPLAIWSAIQAARAEAA